MSLHVGFKIRKRCGKMSDSSPTSGGQLFRRRKGKNGTQYLLPPMSDAGLSHLKAKYYLLFASVVGAFGAVIGETKKFWWLDDDFMIQMLPAVLLLIVWIGAPYFGFNHPDPVIYPGFMSW